ncbi:MULTISPECIES: alpha/beta fold hydrolase [Bradyrhizobium]|uniref:alpha/beta hydrolase n=1 Tax=Bradyrhizobium TaxID=374 RepID=UPI001CD391A7|nr:MULTISPECIES: alpha/beta fold hydrolase [unclassified Bradyrhizobium]MCA1374561.1 alpha/beta hydrolase [Bradyrhizobium sp. IC4060]MCA1425657.1 alpha/beta hydrolase [Bradyrhizobium sp. NBAIM16]MCA1486142.1 alpha/beta hydrolase [Bradyrhizobium sp. IC4061]MCA1504078.1 alpha/beta hydrolase [Bradyrhizobium sp. NBAIM02]MCA1510627.1 alpha/beta hydrolase [Bradyrhizobium sp. NBAIM01]
MSIVKWIAIVLLTVYCAGLLVLYVRQREMLFPIPPAGRTAPDAAGLPEAQEHVLTTSDGEQVIVWHVPAKPGRSVILYFHGNGDFLAGRVGRFKAMTADGTGLVALSYRGYGGSSGMPSEQGLLRDAAAAYAFTTARYAAERIVAWGFSLGTGVAVALASEHRVGKLILEAPYTSTADIAASSFRFVPVRLLMRDPFHSDQRMSRVTVPLLIMHGTNDLVISIVFGERLFALAREPKRFVRIEGGGHDDLDQYGAIETARGFIGG